MLQNLCAYFTFSSTLNVGLKKKRIKCLFLKFCEKENELFYGYSNLDNANNNILKYQDLWLDSLDYIASSRKNQSRNFLLKITLINEFLLEKGEVILLSREKNLNSTLASLAC